MHQLCSKLATIDCWLTKNSKYSADIKHLFLLVQCSIRTSLNQCLAINNELFLIWLVTSIKFYERRIFWPKAIFNVQDSTLYSCTSFFELVYHYSPNEWLCVQASSS